MTANRRTTKKQQRENGSVKSADLAPASSNGAVGQATLESADLPQPSVYSLLADVESFLSRRVELAEKIAAEISATEKKLAELKKIAASLFSEKTTPVQSDRKAKKHKDKSSSREAKSDASVPTENLQAVESAK